MIEDAGGIALMLTSFFTFGCITLHELRQHAKEMTLPLAIAAACLGAFVGLVALAERQEQGRSHGGSFAQTSGTQR